MNKISINWFEIPAMNVTRSADFYGHVLNITLGDMQSPDGLIKTFLNDETPMGAIVSGDQHVPAKEGSLIYLGVSDIDSALERVLQREGEIVLPKTSIGAFGFIAHFIDSEGNRVGLHSI